MAELLSKDAFSKQLNTSFKLSSQSSTTILDLKLTEVQEGRSNKQFEQFSILFTGPQEPILSQSMYRLEHPTMGSFDLFLVPLRSDEGGTVYEAVFSYTRQ